MSSNEYILVDKACQLDKHIITPYQLPKVHSKERIRIEHAFVGSPQWPSLRRVHNFLSLRGEDDDWLEG